MDKLVARMILIASFLTFLTFLFATLANAESYPRFDKFVEAPNQHKIFCKKWPNHCVKIGTDQPAKFDLNNFAKMDHVNRWGNETMKPKIDPPGTDVWEYPKDRIGDCDEYSIFKRAHLLAEGFSSSQLLLTVVWSPRTKWHRVLTVRTNNGDYILDNLSKDVLSVEETIIKYGYVYYWRQSIVNPKQWVQLTSADFSTAFFRRK
jgi:predicted transglutaminase-like cysteine proteinase